MADPLPPETLAGLGTLAALKAAVLPGPLAAGTDYDAVLVTMGKGVAGEFESYLNRQLARQENAIYIVSADRSFVVLPAYPVESVQSLELCYWGAPLGTAPEWDDITNGFYSTLDASSGILDFGGLLAVATARDNLRVTYTGGFWIDDTAAGTGQPPDGATALPADLFRAWTRQVRAEFKADDVAGIGIVRDEKTPALNPNDQEQFLPAVQAVLDRYRRLAV